MLNNVFYFSICIYFNIFLTYFRVAYMWTDFRRLVILKVQWIYSVLYAKLSPREGDSRLRNYFSQNLKILSLFYWPPHLRQLRISLHSNFLSFKMYFNNIIHLRLCDFWQFRIVLIFFLHVTYSSRFNFSDSINLVIDLEITGSWNCCPTLLNHWWAWCQFFAHSVLHFNNNPHSMHSAPFSLLILLLNRW